MDCVAFYLTIPINVQPIKGVRTAMAILTETNIEQSGIDGCELIAYTYNVGPRATRVQPELLHSR